VTPDEMMFEWTGQVGPGGIPFLSWIERKPKPLGSELKSVCEGHFGINAPWKVLIVGNYELFKCVARTAANGTS
jgi:hypothetical protein